MQPTAGNRPPLYSTLAADPDLSELVDLFVAEMPERIAAIELLAHGRNWDQLSQIAHQLKGAAGGYGFPDITRCASQLEATIGGGQPEPIAVALEQLLGLCRRARSRAAQSGP